MPLRSLSIRMLSEIVFGGFMDLHGRWPLKTICWNPAYHKQGILASLPESAQTLEWTVDKAG